MYSLYCSYFCTGGGPPCRACSHLRLKKRCSRFRKRFHDVGCHAAGTHIDIWVVLPRHRHTHRQAYSSGNASMLHHALAMQCHIWSCVIVWNHEVNSSNLHLLLCVITTSEAIANRCDRARTLRRSNNCDPWVRPSTFYCIRPHLAEVNNHVWSSWKNRILNGWSQTDKWVCIPSVVSQQSLTHVLYQRWYNKQARQDTMLNQRLEQRTNPRLCEQPNEHT